MGLGGVAYSCSGSEARQSLMSVCLRKQKGGIEQFSKCVMPPLMLQAVRNNADDWLHVQSTYMIAYDS